MNWIRNKKISYWKLRLIVAEMLGSCVTSPDNGDNLSSYIKVSFANK